MLGLALALLASPLALGLKIWADQPTVYKSWKTQKCVRVEDPANIAAGKAPRTCKTLPTRYDLVWVE